jgi:16S rRNA A1518/A1519 N6-dimethyltransferase RsmA/KsgA/DIM1 with predicted DNA glycosylase/AP lyase activity
VEIDEKLASRLQDRFSGTPHLWIVQADVLQVAPAELLAMESLKLFARQVMPVVRAATGGEE